MEQVEKGTSPAPLEEKAEGIYTSQATLTIAPPPFIAQFLDKSPEASAARAIYLKMLFAGVGALAVVISRSSQSTGVPYGVHRTTPFLDGLL